MYHWTEYPRNVETSYRKLVCHLCKNYWGIPVSRVYEKLTKNRISSEYCDVGIEEQFGFIADTFFIDLLFTQLTGN